MCKYVVITGAASGIGYAISKQFQVAGYQLMLIDYASDVQQIATEMKAHAQQVDLSDPAQCEHSIEQTLTIFPKVDILINNAGIQHVSPVETFPLEKWQQLIAVMLTAPFILTKGFWSTMRQQHWGRVINIASVHGLLASSNKSAYVSAKHGLIGLTKTAALEGAEHGITVNAICPGYVRTPLVEQQLAAQAKLHHLPEEEVKRQVLLKRSAIKSMVTPEEVAEMVEFLASDKAGKVTGASWTIDGGWTAS